MNWAGKLCQKHIDPGDTVLDLGCGTMQATMDTCPTYPKTKLQCKEITGVDAYEPYLTFLQERGIKTVKHDLRKPLPFKNKSFDVCLLLDVLEHLSLKESDCLLNEARRVARKKIIALTPSNYLSNEDAVGSSYDLGCNPLQRHRCLISTSMLKKHGFKILHKKSHPYNYYFGVAEPLKILHVWDECGVGSLICQYLRNHGYEADVIKRTDSMDSLSLNQDGYYQIHSIGKKTSGRIERRLRILRFYITVALLARYYDIVHIHSVAVVSLFIPFKRKLLLFHGDDIRLSPSRSQMWLKKWVNRFIALLNYGHVFVSTPDLLKELPSKWMPNPVDTDLFQRTCSHDLNTAVYFHNWYETTAWAEDVAEKHGLKLTVVDRANNQWIPYKAMPSFLNQFDYLIDRVNIQSLSRTALEALSLGLKVIQYDNRTIEGLDSYHLPENVGKLWLEIYHEMML